MTLCSCTLGRVAAAPPEGCGRDWWPALATYNQPSGARSLLAPEHVRCSGEGCATATIGQRAAGVWSGCSRHDPSRTAQLRSCARCSTGAVARPHHCGVVSSERGLPSKHQEARSSTPQEPPIRSRGAPSTPGDQYSTSRCSEAAARAAAAAPLTVIESFAVDNRGGRHQVAPAEVLPAATQATMGPSTTDLRAERPREAAGGQ